MLAVLSNVNCDTIIKKSKKFTEVVDPNGYGNILGELLHPSSSANDSSVETVVIIVDVQDYLKDSLDYKPLIDDFFQTLRQGIQPDKRYFLNDCDFYLAANPDYKAESSILKITHYWNQCLIELCEERKECFLFPYSELIRKCGASNFYSPKAWYLGSVRHSLEGSKEICGEIERIIKISRGELKKVLVLDLDNTLWGGVAGEDGIEGIKLADSGLGRAYKDFQQQLLRIKESGALLAICSKNNEQDAWDIIENHPHMLLRRADFAASRINWSIKSRNLQEIASELNVGIDSLVFIDDSPTEREEVKSALPALEVPEFPGYQEELANYGAELMKRYFKRMIITAEDRNKTQQYAARRQVEEFKSQASDFAGFLKGLKIQVRRVEAENFQERLIQLLQKTNQFNTTLKRYSPGEVLNMFESESWRFYFYEISDKFANHGLCALVIVNIESNIPVIDNFVMSCRVMGRNIEFGILEHVENDIRGSGFTSLKAEYIQGPKNMPVARLYERAGYELINSPQPDHVSYKKNLENKEALPFFGEVYEC
ncbi:HAD-IIIC family phosphatase [Paenibacillus glufosinatiresistens]|uniref:HAD-IIIC family phosphatase n=1 Tax=Paenibacillus glufosinatiresistens TaxID=3070657 RepID=UPI00286E861C|nr:HAD-IIIC family phosphatase [Paenibacillus sp. YX.27]